MVDGNDDWVESSFHNWENECGIVCILGGSFVRWKRGVPILARSTYVGTVIIFDTPDVLQELLQFSFPPLGNKSVVKIGLTLANY